MKNHTNVEPETGAQAIDPVCGMRVSKDSQHRHAHEGKQYLFCSGSCHDKFVSTPDKYLKPEENTTEEESAASPVYLSDASRNPADRPWRLSEMRYGTGTGRDSGRGEQDRIHLSHAPRNCPGSSWKLPQVWHGAGTANRGSGGGYQ